MSVLLGIDLGDRRIGVACGDTVSGTVTPLLTLRRGTPQQDAAVIVRMCAERHAEALVVGLPLHLDGSESEQSRLTRQWVAVIEPMIAVPVSLRDERHQPGGRNRGWAGCRAVARGARHRRSAWRARSIARRRPRSFQRDRRQGRRRPGGGTLSGPAAPQQRGGPRAGIVEG
jgi:putative Holliday junction resolvase